MQQTNDTTGRVVIDVRPERATRASMLDLHRLGLIRLGLAEDDPALNAGGNAGQNVEITAGLTDEHKLIVVLVDSALGRPAVHPMAETFHIVAHAEPRDAWCLFGFDHTRVAPVAFVVPSASGREWLDLSAAEQESVERANKERFVRGDVGPDDFFCLVFGEESPADLKEYVVFSMPPTTYHGELRLTTGGRSPRFYVDELDLQRKLPEFVGSHGPVWCRIAIESQ